MCRLVGCAARDTLKKSSCFQNIYRRGDFRLNKLLLRDENFRLLLFSGIDDWLFSVGQGSAS